MATSLSSAAVKAAELALAIGSNAADAVCFMADLGEELPVVKPVLSTLKSIREKVNTVKSNREAVAALHERCTFITACFIEKCRGVSPELDVAPLERHVQEMEKVVLRCQQRRGMARWLKASETKDEIARLDADVDRLKRDMGLEGIAILMGKVNEIQTRLDIDRDERHHEPLAKPAQVPNGTPARKSWHVERCHVVHSVIEGLTGDKGPRLVGLVGDSGSGKTTVASEVVRNAEVRRDFSDGIVWLTVNEGAKERLPFVMLELARMVYTNIKGSVGHRPGESDDGAAHVKQCMEKGNRGRGLRCLLVADNVWEKEVVSKLLETGMSILLSTRFEELVVEAQGTPVGVDQMSGADAELVLRRAAELSPETRLPDDAVDLIELCGHVAMDLAFVGRWSTVRGRQDRTAWSDAAEKVRAEMSKVGDDPENDTAKNTRTHRRKAILRAGFEDLAIGSDDERVQRLYLSLAVMPDGHAFTVKDAAVLLHDRTPIADDVTSVSGVVGVLERWSVIGSVGRAYRMHDAHSSFARECIMDRGHVLRPAVKRWVKYISTLKFLRSVDPRVLKGLWQFVEGVGGDGWAQTRPYVKALAEMNEADPSMRKSIKAVGEFQETQEDFEGASSTWHRLLEVERRELGADHPYVLNTYKHLAELAGRLGNFEEAAEWRERELAGLPLAVAKVKKQLDDGGVGGFDDGGLPSVALTILRLTPGHREEAELLSRRWLGIQEAKLGPDDLEVATTRYTLGVCVLTAGRLEEAEGLLVRCLGVQEAKLGSEGEQVLSTLHTLGRCFRKAGRLEEAEDLLRRCLRIREAKLGPEDVRVASTLHQLGICVRMAGRLEEAEGLLRRCVGIREVAFGPEHVNVAYTLRQLGISLRKAGRPEEAEEYLRRCLGIFESKLDSDDEKMVCTLLFLGTSLHHMARLEEAEEMFRRCLNIGETMLSPDDVLVVPFVLHHLGVCVREAGRLSEAVVLWGRCLAIVEAILARQDEGMSVPTTSDRQLRKRVRHLAWLEKARKCLKRYLAIGELKLGDKNTGGADEILQELGVCLAEAYEFRRC